MIGVVNTIWIWGFLGLLAPVVIHLLSKKTKRVIPFGSLKFLQSSETKTIRSLQPSDLWMLMLRALIVSLLVMILTSVFVRKEKETQVNLIISDQYKKRPETERLLDSISEEVAVQWLDENYIFNEYSFKRIHPSDSNVLIAPIFVDQVDHRIPGNSLFDRWIVLPVENTKDYLKGIKKENSAIKINAYTSEMATYATHLPSNEEGEEIVIRYIIETEQTFENLKQIIYSALMAIEKKGWVSMVEVNDSTKADWIFWLSEGKINTTKKLLKPGETSDGRVLEQITKHQYIISNSASLDQSVSQNLPIQLQNILYEGLLDYNEDFRIFPEEFFPPARVDKEILITDVSVDHFLWIVLLALMVFERILATRRV